MTPPPLQKAEKQNARDNLRRLGVYYILFGLMALPGIIILSVQHRMIDQLFSSIESLYGIAGHIDLKMVFEMLSWGILTMTVVHLVSFIWIGLCFRKQDNYFACITAAVLCCLSVPLGTILGVFSLINLNSPEGKELFGRS
ncbi:MAG: hypothetical protein ACPGN3_06430 [Opitutales bacterium]